MAASTRFDTARLEATAILAITAAMMTRPLATDSATTMVLDSVGRGDICVACELRRPDVRQHRLSVYTPVQQVAPVVSRPVLQQDSHVNVPPKQFLSAFAGQLGAEAGVDGVNCGGVTNDGGTNAGGVTTGGVTNDGGVNAGGVNAGGVTKDDEPEYGGPLMSTTLPVGAVNGSCGGGVTGVILFEVHTSWQLLAGTGVFEPYRTHCP